MLVLEVLLSSGDLVDASVAAVEYGSLAGSLYDTRAFEPTVH